MAAKTKSEFTVQDMKKAFYAGVGAGHHGLVGNWHFDRWIRSKYPARYQRKAPKPKKP